MPPPRGEGAFTATKTKLWSLERVVGILARNKEATLWRGNESNNKAKTIIGCTFG